MNKPQNRSHRSRDSTDVVAPYARVRVVMFLICMAIALVVLAYKVFAA